MPKISLREIVADWDAKDVRNVVISILLVIVPLYFRQITTFIIDTVVATSVLGSNKYIDNLYLSASGEPGADILIMMFMFTAFLPIIMMFFFAMYRRAERRVRSAPYGAVAFGGVVKPRAVASTRIAGLIVALLSFSMLSILVTSIIFPVQAASNFHKRLIALSNVMSNKEKADIQSQ